MFDFLNNKLFDINGDDEVDIFEKALAFGIMMDDEDEEEDPDCFDDDFFDDDEF